jgi:hypothetical protein
VLVFKQAYDAAGTPAMLAAKLDMVLLFTLRSAQSHPAAKAAAAVCAGQPVQCFGIQLIACPLVCRRLRTSWLPCWIPPQSKARRCVRPHPAAWRRSCRSCLRQGSTCAAPSQSVQGSALRCLAASQGAPHELCSRWGRAVRCCSLRDVTPTCCVHCSSCCTRCSCLCCRW